MEVESRYYLKQESDQDLLNPKIIFLPTIDSTNLYCMREMAQLADGTMVVADEQTEGRGRMGRKWYSPKGNLYASLVLKPPLLENKSIWLTPQIAALAAFEVLSEFGCKGVWIKWPNDLYVNGRKIAGILSEGYFQGEKIIGLVVGIGVNLNMREIDLQHVDKPATSLLIETGSKVARDDFARAFYERFQTLYGVAQKFGFEKIYPAWRSAASRLLNRQVIVNMSGSQVVGKVIDFGKDGSLILAKDDGGYQSFYYGEVSLHLLA